MKKNINIPQIESELKVLNTMLKEIQHLEKQTGDTSAETNTIFYKVHAYLLGRIDSYKFWLSEITKNPAPKADKYNFLAKINGENTMANYMQGISEGAIMREYIERSNKEYARLEREERE